MVEWFGTKCFVVPSSQRLGSCPGDCPGDSCRLGCNVCWPTEPSVTGWNVTFSLDADPSYLRISVDADIREIALDITTGAFVLSFAVQRDLARQALIPEHLTWIFPAFVDSAILGSTIAIVIISKLNLNKRDRGFYIALAVSVVVISIFGNAYHAAIAAQESIDGGGDFGFIPLAPAIAIIPPALVLAFTHGITILVKAVGMAYAAYRAIVENAADSEDAQRRRLQAVRP